MCTVKIDISTETVAIDSGSPQEVVLRGQWVSFYLTLALRVNSEHDFVEASELREFRTWSQKKRESVGKEVAHHLKKLQQKGFEGLILSDGKTSRWRLQLLPGDLHLLPSSKDCAIWLDGQRNSFVPEELPVALMAWLRHTTKALIFLEEGKIEEGLGCIALAEQENGGSFLLGAIAELIEVRLRARIGEYPRDRKYLGKDVGKIGMALTIRADLAQALEPSGTDLKDAIEACHRLGTRLEAVPDINGAGTAYNALGVLLRRNGQFDEAQKCLRYAVALLVASFDLPTLQAALFNLGHALYKTAINECDLRDSLSLIQLDREICWALGLGRDSAQAEVVAGILCLKLGERRAAREWLKRGRAIVATLNSDYNKACLERLSARIRWVSAWTKRGVREDLRQKILEDYRKASELLLTAGFPTASLEQEVKIFQRGEKPKWLVPCLVNSFSIEGKI